jgi:hypothetical protein
VAWLIEVIKANKPSENAFAAFLLTAAAVGGFFVALSVLGWAGLLNQGVAAWVQAIGSIGAILGAIWISNRDRKAKIIEAERKDGLVQEQVGFEVANLAYDVTQFLARTSDADQTKRPRYSVDEAEFNELLERMSWVRRTAMDASDLEDTRTLRSNLVETTALFRTNARWDRTIPQSETDHMKEWQEECAQISRRRHDQRGKHFNPTESSAPPPAPAAPQERRSRPESPS